MLITFSSALETSKQHVGKRQQQSKAQGEQCHTGTLGYSSGGLNHSLPVDHVIWDDLGGLLTCNWDKTMNNFLDFPVGFIQAVGGEYTDTSI